MSGKSREKRAAERTQAAGSNDRSKLSRSGGDRQAERAPRAVPARGPGSVRFLRNVTYRPGGVRRVPWPAPGSPFVGRLDEIRGW